MADITADEIADELKRSGIFGYEVALAKKDQRIAELEAALTDLIDAVQAGDQEKIKSALFVGMGLTF